MQWSEEHQRAFEKSLPVSSGSCNPDDTSSTSSGTVSPRASVSPHKHQQFDMQQQRRQHEQQQFLAGDLDFNQATLNFLRQRHLADIWLPKGLEESLLNSLPGHLVGIAAQACQELSVAASEPKHAPDATFTDHLPSSKGTFLCAEANPDLGESLMVLAIKESLLSWPDYFKALHVIDPDAKTALENVQPHSAVRAAMAELPLQQLAWMTSDIGCRLIITGKGTAGAIAQEATLQLQQLVRAQSTGQDSDIALGGQNSDSDRILCVTFGAPPSFNPAQQPQGLIWNFMLAKKEVSYTTHTEASYLADLVPAIASTVPFSPDSAVNWLEAVSDIIATLNAARVMHRAVFVQELQAAVDQLLAAGTVRQGYKGFLGPVWLMHEPVDSLQRDDAGQGSTSSHHWAPSPGLWMPQLLSKYLDIGRLDKRHVNSAQMKDYWDIASQAFPSVLRYKTAASANLLQPLKLSQDIRGFFKPLTAIARGMSEINQHNTMVGCQVTLEGVGVQWADSQAPKLELFGPGFDQQHVPFEVEVLKPSRIKVQSAANGANAASASHDKQALFEGNAAASSSSEPQALGGSATYRAKAHGRLPKSTACWPAPESGAGAVKVFIVLTTYFGQQRLQLEIEPAEPERRNVRSAVASGPVANQLQRAVVKAFCCLTAPSGTSQQAQQDSKVSHDKGLEILDAIDELERWCRVLPDDLPGKYAAQVRQTMAQTDWPAEQTIKQLIMAKAKASRGQESLIAFQHLDIVNNVLGKLYQSISAVLAGPLLLQYDTTLQEKASAWLLLGLVCAMTFAVPEALIATACVATSLRTVAAAVYDGAPLSWTWWGMQKVYLIAYEKKVEELLDMLVPGGRYQNELSVMEDCLVEACDRAREAHSHLGQLLDGPKDASAPQTSNSDLPLVWKEKQLRKKQIAWKLPNGRKLTTSCMQVLSVDLNRIGALHKLRSLMRNCCLVGLIGDINAGKTTLYRLLLGLQPIANGQAASNATRYIAGEQLKLRTWSGLQATSQSPIIIDTPGMFDPDKTLTDAARFRGAMALYVVVVSAQQAGRNEFNENLRDSILEIVNLGRPVLICVNMVSEKLQSKWWETASDTARATKEIKHSLESRASRGHGSITVFMTECLFFKEHEQKMMELNVKTVEDVRKWICQTAQDCDFDVPTAIYDADDFENVLSPTGPGTPN